ncbi:SWIM zinc finger family protein [Deferribacter abyssi]|uniref:SWIM zinc finger family protein n=1 Tax=Deferribacter abyssi TaxID=213806 RepID=UPI003C1644D0
MKLLKLTEDQLRNICTPINLQRAENYVGKFFDCKIQDNIIVGKIKGNHGVYNVSLKIDSDPLEYSCECKTSKEMFCKHAAALGLTYIYTPWVFETDEKIERDSIKTLDELSFYLKTTKLKTLIDELRKKGVGVAKLSDLIGVSLQQIAAILKDEEKDKYHVLTDSIKLACLYILEKDFEV